jgi:hypothetical protein
MFAVYLQNLDLLSFLPSHIHFDINLLLQSYDPEPSAPRLYVQGIRNWSLCWEA